MATLAHIDDVPRPGTPDVGAQHRRAAILALTSKQLWSRLRPLLPDASVRLVTDTPGLKAALSSDRPLVALLTVPPADQLAIETLAAERRRRGGMAAVLVTPPAAMDTRLEALRLGFDHAIARPLEPPELAGRLAILAAREGRSRGPRLAVAAGIQLDLASHELIRDGVPVHLRPKEFRLLELLARHRGRVFDRTQLLERVWGGVGTVDPRTIDVHVRWVRAKVEPDPDHPQHLVTVRGLGYLLRAPER